MNDATVELTETSNQTSGKKGPPKKPLFDLSTALDANGAPIALDDDGRLTGVPHNWTGDFKKLGARDFTAEDKGLVYEFKAQVLNQEIVEKTAKRDEMLEEAKIARTPLSETELKQRKLLKLQKQLADLEAQLAEQGINA